MDTYKNEFVAINFLKNLSFCCGSENIHENLSDLLSMLFKEKEYNDKICKYVTENVLSFAVCDIYNQSYKDANTETVEKKLMSKFFEFSQKSEYSEGELEWISFANHLLYENQEKYEILLEILNIKSQTKH